jgi:hypothetical protein
MYIHLVFGDSHFPVTSTIFWIYHGASRCEHFSHFMFVATMELWEADSDDEIIAPLGVIDFVEEEYTPTT